MSDEENKLLLIAEEKIEALQTEIKLLRNENIDRLIASCPFCAAEAKIQQAGFEISCSNFACGVKPRARSHDLYTAISKWEGRVDNGASVSNE